YSNADLWLAGFSFGSAVMLRAAACDDRVRAIIAVGVPVARQDFSDVAHCNKPKLLIQGSNDQYGPLDQLEMFFESLDEPKQMIIIDDADHFFEGHLP